MPRHEPYLVKQNNAENIAPKILGSLLHSAHNCIWLPKNEQCNRVSVLIRRKQPTEDATQEQLSVAIWKKQRAFIGLIKVNKVPDCLSLLHAKYRRLVHWLNFLSMV
ncbi:hypothetical protein ISCGN_021128 [Ixodes scapularis]